MKTKKIIYSIIILLGISAGIISGLGDFSSSFMIFILIAIIGILSLIITFVGIIKSNQLASYGIVTLFSIIMFFLGLKFTVVLLDNYRENKAEKVIAKIEDYKKEKGKIPENLKTINSQNELKILEYSPERKMKHFTVGYSIDSWNFKIYDSRTRKWKVVD